MINTSLMSRKERVFYFKLIEFAENTDKNKFYKGNKMSHWFYKNIDIIKEMENYAARDIISQYNSSGFNFDEKILVVSSSRDMFEKRLKEFSKENGTYKFKFLSKEPLFKDNTRMGIWFVENKNDVLTSNDHYCMQIREQYKNYLEHETAMTNDEKYKKRLLEFCNEKDYYSKFKSYGIAAVFSDGVSMNGWYYENKERIEESCDELSQIIKAQFRCYLDIKGIKKKEKSEILYRNKLLSFMQEEDYGKFSQIAFVEFKDGSNMGSWFNVHKSTIFNSNDDISNEIKMQHENYLESIDKRNYAKTYRK